MVDKYYTPEIEEFHVGFEYEVEDLGDDGKTRVWRPQIFEGEETRTYFIEELKKGEIRVKYLDREDIESLSEGETSRGLLILKDSEFDYKRILCILVEGNYVIIGNDLKGNGYEQLFQGKIKNKSELKKLLKQLRINENI